MIENYLDNLIYTEYIHDIQILEDVSDIIPEYISVQKKESIKKIEEPIEVQKELCKDKIAEKEIKPIPKKESIKKKEKKELIDIDLRKVITKKVISNKPEEATLGLKTGLLEFDYIHFDYSFDKAHSLKAEKHPFKEWLDLINSKQKNTNENNVKKDFIPKKNGDNHLINEFIEANPKIIPGKDSNADMDFSIESVKEKSEYFTETLAKIYIKQKAFAKAISAYEKLSFKYPEKRAYFAVQVEKINKLSNNK